MQLTYQELPEYQFPYWIEQHIEERDDNLMHYIDVNQWCGEQFGNLGDNWGYERKIITLPHPGGLNPVKVRMFYTKLRYSWRFKNKADAMAFKLAWGGK